MNWTASQKILKIIWQATKLEEKCSPPLVTKNTSPDYIKNIQEVNKSKQK